DARLELESKLRGFARAYGRLAAKAAKLDLVVDAGAGLIDAGGDAVSSVAGDLAGGGDLQAAIGASCAVQALGPTRELLADTGESLSATANAVGTVTAAVGS